MLGNKSPKHRKNKRARLSKPTPTPLPQELARSLELAELLHTLSLLLQQKETKLWCQMVEQNLRTLYYKERVWENFCDILLKHRELWTQNQEHKEKSYTAWLRELLVQNEIPSVLADLLEKKPPRFWSAEFLYNNALEAEKKKQFQKALDYCSLMQHLVGKSAQTHLIRGRVLEQLGAFDAAADAFKQAIELDHDNFSAYHRLAVHFLESSPQTALPYIERAAALHPASGAILTTQARVYRNLEQYPKALKIYDQAINLTSQNAVLYEEKAQILERVQQPMSAIGQYRRAIQQDPLLVQSHRALARLLQKDMPEEAIQAAKAALALEPLDVETLFLLANLLALLQKTAEAEAQLEALLAHHPEYAPAWGLLAQLREEFPPAALVCYQKAVLLAPNNPTFHFGLARMLEQTVSPDDALPEYEATVALDPTHHQALFALSTLLGKDLPRGLAYIEQALVQQPENALYLLQKAKLLAQGGYTKEAIACLNQAVHLDPTNPEIHFQLGRLLEEEGLFSSAAERYREVLRLVNQHAPSQAALSRLLMERDPSSALASIDHALQLEPANPAYLFQKANVLYHMCVRTGHIPFLVHGRPAEPDFPLLHAAEEATPANVLSFLEAALEQDPDNWTYSFAKGRVLTAIGQHRKAMEWHRRALARNHQNHRAHFGMANLLSWKSRHKALPLLDKAIALSPTSAAYYARKAEILLFEPPDEESALACYNAALELLPSNWRFLLAKAKLLEHLHRHNEAAEHYREVLYLHSGCAEANARLGYLLTNPSPIAASELLAAAVKQEPHNTTYRLWLARAYTLAGGPEQAANQYSYILEQKGDSPETRYQLAKELEPLLPEIALRHIEEALRTEPENSRYLVQKGNIFTLLGREEEAMTQYKKAFSADPSNGVSLFRQAQILLHHRDAEAAVLIENAVQLEPTRVEILLLRAKIAEELLSNNKMAAQSIKAAIRLDPYNHKLRMEHVRLLANTKKPVRLALAKLLLRHLHFGNVPAPPTTPLFLSD